MLEQITKCDRLVTPQWIFTRRCEYHICQTLARKPEPNCQKHYRTNIYEPDFTFWLLVKKKSSKLKNSKPTLRLIIQWSLRDVWDYCWAAPSVTCIFIQIKINWFAWFYIQPSTTSLPVYLHRVHPSSHSGERGGLSYVIHGQDSVCLTIVLLSDAAEPERTLEKIRKIIT